MAGGYAVQNYCSPERSSRAGHRFWVFLIGLEGFASCPTKCFIKSSTVLTPFTSSFLQFRAAEVMHCAKFSHRRCFLAKQERKLRIKSFPEKGKCCFPLLWSPESGQLQPFQAFGDFGDEKWPAEAEKDREGHQQWKEEGRKQEGIVGELGSLGEEQEVQRALEILATADPFKEGKRRHERDTNGHPRFLPVSPRLSLASLSHHFVCYARSLLVSSHYATLRPPVLSREERKLHNKSPADKELVAFIFWEVPLLSSHKKSA